MNGLNFLKKNVRSPHGEIDLIMKDGGTIVFVEVKTRASTENGYPEEAVTENKKNHLENSISWYLEQNLEIGDDWRLDIVTVIGRPGAKDYPRIDWWQNDF
jgi:putative endonuclease